MIDNDKTQAMFTFALLSTLLILSGIRTVGDGLDWDSPRSPASAVTKIHRRVSYMEPVFYGGFVQPPQRRLLEHPRRAKQVYCSCDYNVARRHRQPRNKFDEGGPYRSSALRNDEDEEEEEEENQGDEEDKLDDEGADEETAEQNDEETVNEEPSEVYDYG